MSIIRTFALVVALLAALTSAVVISGPAVAQSVKSECNDGIDNDNDGAVDGADGACQSESGSVYGDIPQPKTVAVAIPVVTLQGTVSAKGVVTVKKLQVRGSRGTTVRVVCKGKACPAKAFRGDITGRTLRVKRFERKLRPPMVLTMRSGRAGLLGKLIRYTIRRNMPPLRVDKCFDGQTDLVTGCFIN